MRDYFSFVELDERTGGQRRAFIYKFVVIKRDEDTKSAYCICTYKYKLFVLVYIYIYI